MYDFAMLKGRVEHQLDQVAAIANWNPLVVNTILQLTKIFKNIQQVEKLEWEEHQRMTNR